MYWQQRYLKESRQLESYTTGLETVDLPKTGFLSGLELRFWGASASDDDKPDCWIHDRLKKIEVIVNGSKVVKSLAGNQLLADMLYKKTQLKSNDMRNMQGISSEEHFFINFGRFYHDTEYMLDLSKVNDPELRLDYDFSLTGHDGWTNGVAYSAAPYYSLIPHILRDAPMAPKGYIKTSEVARFTSGTSKKENMMLPIGPVYANLYLQCFYASHGWGVDIDKVELNINNDAIIPFKAGVQDLAAQLARLYGLFQIMESAIYKGAQAYPACLEHGRYTGKAYGYGDFAVAASELWGQTQDIAIVTASTGLSLTTAKPCFINFLGTLPWSVAAIPVFDLMDERTWIDSSKLGDLWLRVEETSSAASSTPKLLADEVVTTY